MRLLSIVGMILVSTVALAAEPMWLEPRLKPLPIDQTGPFVNLADGSILCVRDDSALISADDGRTWQAHPMFGDRKLRARPEQALIRTSRGVVVCIFIDDLDKQWKWDAGKNTAEGDVWLYVWSARSLDEGKTWTDVHRIQDGYCGAIRDIIETDGGNLVLPSQKYLPQASRHATIPMLSTDQGKTWKTTGLLDVGGHGHHDGSIEATVAQLRDGRLWMLLRTNLDRFWQAWSSDGGMSWSGLSASDIDASSSPGMLKRLASGRLALLWNRLYPEGKSDYRRRSGQNSEKPASWQREELSIAFSQDEGRSWSAPVVIARQQGARVSYPHLLERRPGILWITTMQGGLKAELKESDFTSGAPAAGTRPAGD